MNKAIFLDGDGAIIKTADGNYEPDFRVEDLTEMARYLESLK
ncbi:MAG: hypothetical protein Q8R00_02240 [Candidatus Nanoarchaeia archaeon]|nr:hypothetical protein [Candidatus Nanoarchaeia archaeon]